MADSLFVGIDVSRESMTIALHSSTGELLENIFTTGNNQAGVDTLIAKLLSYLTNDPSLQVVIGCEATGIYSFHLLHVLATSGQLGVCHCRGDRCHIVGCFGGFPDDARQSSLP